MTLADTLNTALETAAAKHARAVTAARKQYLRMVNLCDGAWDVRFDPEYPDHGEPFFRKAYDAKLAAHEFYLRLLNGAA